MPSLQTTREARAATFETALKLSEVDLTSFCLKDRFVSCAIVDESNSFTLYLPRDLVAMERFNTRMSPEQLFYNPVEPIRRFDCCGIGYALYGVRMDGSGGAYYLHDYQYWFSTSLQTFSLTTLYLLFPYGFWIALALWYFRYHPNLQFRRRRVS